VAVAISSENARLNRVGRRVRVLLATGLRHPAVRRARPFDLVLANILPGPLVALAPALRRALKCGGVGVLSGLLSHQEREVAATYNAAGFHLLHRLERSGWTALVVERRLERRRTGRHQLRRSSR